MNFKKKDFMMKNSQRSWEILIDFLNIEIKEENFKTIYTFLKVGNFRKGEYEGNKHVLKKLYSEEVVIIDLSVEEKDNNSSPIPFCLTVNEMITIMDNIDEWRKYKIE
ncbi:hypothetical protein ACFSGI_00015 [Paenibacillus nicotianae]|uniref:Uncharacterized protein n=1 Tax=Paenibacillus nicotianae TaxID=1526551 RepID=A0ABW4UPM8_9BACL